MNFTPISYFATVILSLLSLTINAQMIKGVVQDAVTHAPLPFANVFLNNTTKGTVTDEKGEFLLKVLHEPGSYELVVSYVGYESYKSRVSLEENEVLSATVLLAPSEQELKDVEVKATRDKAWEKQFKRFQKVFLGDDKLADSCKILNPWVIDFVQEKSGKMLAYASEPIDIENNGMGYKLRFHLKYFWTDRTGYFIAGNVQFAEKPSSDENQVLQWQLNRKISYLRSRHHLFKAIVERRIHGEGFLLYSEGNNVNANVRSPYFKEDLGKIMFPYDTNDIVKPGKGNNFVITLKGRVEVHYQNQKPAVPTYRDVPYAVSWLRLSSNRVVVKKDGYELVPADVTVSGDMSAARVSRMLPLDYKPTDVIPVRDKDKELLQPFKERIYVHTNKPYYHSGEPLWFKGYIKYTNPTWRDSLSRTVYVELISPERKIVLSKTLEVFEGSFYNDFILPGSLEKGTYYLRAYTNFNRNFGDSSLYVKQIPILGDDEQAAPVPAKEMIKGDSSLFITVDKTSYKPREKVVLTVNTFGDDGLPITGNASIAVTDDQVVPISSSTSIVQAFQNDDNTKVQQLEIGYPVEYGFGFSGRFLNNNGKPEMTLLNGVQLNSGNIIFSQSDENGLFAISGLNHYDTAVFLLKSDKAIEKPYGRVELLRHETAPARFEAKPVDVPLLSQKVARRTVTEYELPIDARLLKEVVVRADEIKDNENYRVKRPYGKPDYVLTAKDINASYGNLLQTLPGKVPGLVVRYVHNEGELPRWMVYLQRQGSILFPSEVLVTVNDVVMSGTPAQIIGSVDPSTIETIEVKNGINVLYGSSGGSGIVAIYTKSNVNNDQIKRDAKFSQLKVPGYSRARSFRFPDYGDPATDRSQNDFRSTIYWNPTITTDPNTGKASVSFYAADLEGTYRIIAEGISQDGEPMHCEYSVTVKK
jgi:hypothetical protein